MSDNNDDLNRKISDAYLKILDLKKEDPSSKSEVETETSQEEPNYQDILDKYAASINTRVEDKIPEAPLPSEAIKINEVFPDLGELSSKPQPEELPLPETPEEPEETEEKVLPLDSPSVPDAIAPSIIHTETSNENEVSLETQSVPKENNFFKYLFFFSLFIFIIVLVSVIISFVNSQKSLSGSANTPTIVSSPTNVPPSTVCEINDQKYDIGQSFTATDNCNTCTCNADLTISCTENTCTATPTAKLSPTTTKKIPTLILSPTKITTQ